MKRLELAFNVFVAIVVLAIVMAGVWTWRERQRLYNDIVSTIEVQATAAIGLPVEIGGIEGLWWKNLVLRDVKVRGWNAKTAPVVLNVPHVRANYSVTEILRLGKKPIEIVVENPTITLERDAAGKFNVRPIVRPSREPGEPPKFPIHVAVQGGAITWLDSFQATSSQVVPFGRRFPLAGVDVTLRNGVLRYIAQARDGLGEIGVRGQHDLVHGKGDTSARAKGLAIADWSGYGIPSDDYRILKGTVDVVAKVDYDLAQLDRLGVSGQAWVKDLTLEHKDVAALLEHVAVDAAFDLKQVRLKRLAASMAGNTVSGHGTVDIRNPKDPKLDLQFEIPKVDLASARLIVPELTPFGISGVAGGTARVHGSSLDPIVDVKAQIGRAVALKERLGPGTADVRYFHQKADISSISLDVHGGQATGGFWFTMDEHPEAGGKIAFADVDLAGAAAPYLPRPLPLHGRLSGTVDIAGPMDSIRIAGSADLRDGAFGRQPIDSGRADFGIYRGNITVSDIKLTAPDGGVLTGDLGWDEGGDLVLEMVARDLDLAALQRAGLDVDISGRASATLAAAGNMLAPDSLEFQGRIVAGPGQAYGQPIDDVAGNYRLVGGRLVLTEISGHTAGGQVDGNGVIAPISFERELSPPDYRFDFDVAGADLKRIPAVVKAAEEPLGGLSGHFGARGVHLAVTKGAFSMTGNIDATAVDAPRLGGSAAVSGGFALSGQRLTLNDVLIAQGPARVEVAGDVVLRADPELALRIRTQRADIRNLLGTVHWRRLLQGTWMARRTEEAAAGRPVPFAQLPDRELESQYDPSQALDLSAVYNHWLSASATPSVVTAEHIKAARPFWESLDGTLDAEIRLDGTARDPFVFVQADIEGGNAYGHALSTASMLAWYGRGELAVDHLEIEAAQGGAASAKGALGNDRSLELEAHGLDLSWLNPFLQGQDVTLSGKAAAKIVATGALEKPKLTITATSERGQISDFLYDSANAQASFENGLLDIQECALVKDGKEARVAGTIPIGLRPEDTALNLSLDVRGTSLGIVSVLSKGLIDWRGGDGTLRVDIIGTQATPRLRGALKLQGARIAVKTLTGEISDINAEALIGDRIVKVEKATARYGGGRIEVAGFITMKQFKFENYLLDLWATPLNLVLPNGMFDGTVDGHLSVGGKFEHPSVTGEVTVSKGTLSLAATGGQGGGGGPEPEGAPVDISGLNVTIKDQVKVVQPNLMNLRVYGNLAVNGPMIKPGFKGIVNVVKGGKITTFYTNEFTVEEGNVEFLGEGRPDEESDLVKEFLPSETSSQAVAGAVPNARVYVVATGETTDYQNLHGHHQVAGDSTASISTPTTVKVKAIVTGTLSDLKFTFQSDPPEYTQKEIETLLGKPSLVTGVIDQGTGGFTPILREVAPRAANWWIKQTLNPILDPVLGGFLRDYSLDLVNDPTREGLFAGIPGYNFAVSAETRPLVGSLTATYRRVINPAQSQKDLKRYGLNLGSIPINTRVVSPGLDWLSSNVIIQDLTLGGFIEDVGGGTEIPGGLDMRLPGDLSPVAANDLSLFRRSDPWRWSIQVGIRGRL